MSRFTRRALLGAAALTPFARPALAAFPDQAIRVIVPWNAGGLADILMRSVAPEMGRLLASRGDRNSAPDEIAGGIARAVKDPSCPFRIALGHAAPELMGLRSRLSDEEWIALANRPSREFVAAIDSAEPAFGY